MMVTWYNRGLALGNLGKHEEAIASYDKEYQEMAITDSDFDNIRKDSRFQALIE